MQCPKCRLENPNSALRCDCGYDFSTGQVKASYVQQNKIHDPPAMNCPKCGSENAETAIRCACGCNLPVGQVKTSEDIKAFVVPFLEQGENLQNWSFGSGKDGRSAMLLLGAMGVAMIGAGLLVLVFRAVTVDIPWWFEDGIGFVTWAVLFGVIMARLGDRVVQLFVAAVSEHRLLLVQLSQRQDGQWFAIAHHTFALDSLPEIEVRNGTSGRKNVVVLKFETLRKRIDFVAVPSGNLNQARAISKALLNAQSPTSRHSV